MNYGKLNKHDIANGTGVRVSLFVSGCRNFCKGCFNSETWDFDYGEKYTGETTMDIIDALEPEHIDGLSILGGDPFEPENLDVVTALCWLVKRLYGDQKSIWVYTGYNYESLTDAEIMQYIDVLVDGRFIEAQKDISLKFRGSKNQRIIDVQASRASGSVVVKEV